MASRRLLNDDDDDDDDDGKERGKERNWVGTTAASEG